MNKSDNLYSDIISGLQGKQPSLEHSREMTDGVMERIAQRKQKRYVLALRFCAIAASLALIFGISSIVEVTPQNNKMALPYLQQALPHKTDGAYLQNKYLKRNQYELIKQNYYENNN